MKLADNERVSKVGELLYERPWTLPIVITMLVENRYLSAREIAEVWGTRTSIVKRGLWWLTKYGLVERLTNEVTKYKLKDEILLSFKKLLRERWTRDNKLVIRRGSIYFVITVRKKRILARAVTEDVVEKVKEALATCKEKKLSNIVQATGLSPKLVSVALKVLSVKGEV